MSYKVSWQCIDCKEAREEEFPFKPHGAFVLQGIVDSHGKISPNCKSHNEDHLDFRVWELNE